MQKLLDIYMYFIAHDRMSYGIHDSKIISALTREKGSGRCPEFRPRGRSAQEKLWPPPTVWIMTVDVYIT